MSYALRRNLNPQGGIRRCSIINSASELFVYDSLFHFFIVDFFRNAPFWLSRFEYLYGPRTQGVRYPWTIFTFCVGSCNNVGC